MREKFLKKLKKDQRNFKWFYDNYIKGKRNTGLKYGTLYQQSKGDFLTTMNGELKKAIHEYLKGK
jgi:hypothetical protein